MPPVWLGADEDAKAVIAVRGGVGEIVEEAREKPAQGSAGGTRGPQGTEIWQFRRGEDRLQTGVSDLRCIAAEPLFEASDQPSGCGSPVSGAGHWRIR